MRFQSVSILALKCCLALPQLSDADPVPDGAVRRPEQIGGGVNVEQMGRGPWATSQGQGQVMLFLNFRSESRGK